MRPAVKVISISLLLLCQSVTNLLLAQSAGFLEGKVFDSATSKPIPFAEIKLKSNQLSFYSNAEGNFSIIHSSDFQSDSLVISCIGYKKYSLASKELNADEIKKIWLTPSQDIHEEVKVTARDGKLNSIAIIRRAIGNLNTRYPVKPFDYVSYYRDYQKKDSSYINLNEAIIQTFDSGFTSASISDIHRLMYFRKNMSFPRMEMIPVNNFSDSIDPVIRNKLIPEDITSDQYGNEITALLTHDPIRNFTTRSVEFFESFSKNFIDNHNFSPPLEVLNDNLPLFKITFNGKTGIIADTLLISGAIYIQQKDYSIHKLEYSCYTNTKGKGLKKLFNLGVEYGHDNKTDSLMCLKYISYCRLFNVIDTDNKSYFSLLNSQWDSFSNISPTLSLSFNNKVDPVISTRKENFTIIIGKREVKIKNIQAVGEKIFMRFNNEDVKGMTDSCEVYTQDLKDIYGNSLYKRKSMDIYQYRELFVQEFNYRGTSKHKSIIQDLSPVSDTIPAIGRKVKYWMNTPKTR